jgi:hypothetical protein
LFNKPTLVALQVGKAVSLRWPIGKTMAIEDKIWPSRTRPYNLV